MKKSYSVCILLFGICFKSPAQQRFNKIIYKQPGNLIYHSNYNATKTNTGGYAIAQANGSNAYTAVFDSSLNLLWARNINIQSTHKSAGLSIAQSTLDSSFCMLGVTSDPLRPEYDLILSKMTKKGKPLGTVSVLYGSSAGGFSRILALPGGKFLIGVDNGTGTIGLLVLNEKGKFIRIKNISYGSYTLLFQDLIPTSDGGFMLTGNVLYNYGPGQRDVFCTKLNRQLNIEWTKIYATGALEEITGIIETKEKGFFMFGYQLDGFTANSRFVKLNAAGDVEWNRLVHFASNSTPYSAVQTYDGGYALTGTELYKFNKKGIIAWISKQSFTQSAYPVLETKDHGLLTFSQYDPFQFNVIKTDSAGNTCNPSYDRTYTLLNDSLNIQSASFTVSNGSIQHINTGSVFTDAGNTGYLLCQLPSMASQPGRNDLQNGLAVKQNNSPAIILYPNPVKEKLTLSIQSEKASKIKLIIAGAAGNIVLQKEAVNNAGGNMHQLHTASFSTGVYFITVISPTEKTTLKFIKE